MPDHRRSRAVVLRHRHQVAGEVGQGGAGAPAAAVRGLVEGHHCIARVPQGLYPPRHAGAVAGPAVGEQHVGLGARVAPDVGVDGNAVDAEVFLARAERRCGFRPRATGGEWGGEQARGFAGDGIGRDMAAQQESQAHCMQSKEITNGRANSG